MEHVKKEYDFSMFEGQILPIKGEENITIKLWIWRIVKSLYWIFIVGYFSLGVFAIYKIGLMNGDDAEIKIIIGGLFILLFVIFGFIFLYLKVFLKPLQPKYQKITLTKNTLQINEKIINLDEVIGILVPQDSKNTLLHIYVDIDSSYAIKTTLISGLSLFLKNNFPDAHKLIQKKQEETLRQELGEKYHEYENIAGQFPFEKMFGFFLIFPLGAIFIPALHTISLCLIALLLLIILGFVRKFQIHKLSFLHKSFWICCGFIVFFMLTSNYVHFLSTGKNFIFIASLVSIGFFLRALLKKSSNILYYWHALFVLSISVIIVGLNIAGQWLYPAQNDEIKIENIEYVSGRRSLHYKIRGVGEKIGRVEDFLVFTTKQMETENKATIKIYKGLFGIDFYTY